MRGPRTLLAPATIAAALLLAALPGPAAARPGYTKGVANAELAAAARRTPLALIDYGEVLCRNDRTVEDWLKALVGDEALAIRWTGGPCQLVTDLNPLDAGGDWCAQARILLRHPRDRHDQPMVEIFFDRPKPGGPLVAYAFRGDIADSGLIRFRREFESAWLERFPATTSAVSCEPAE